MITNNTNMSNNFLVMNTSKISWKNNTYSDVLKEKRNLISDVQNSINKAFQSFIILYDSRCNQVLMDSYLLRSIKRIEEIASLEYDWNGYGASPFSHGLIAKCKEIVKNLEIQPQIYPTGRKSIQFQYELSDRSYLEFEIFEDKTLCLIVPKRVYKDARTLEFHDRENIKIKEVITEFYGQYD